MAIRPGYGAWLRPSLLAPLIAAAMLIAGVFLFAGADFMGAEGAEPDFPALTGRVVDNANLLSAEDERLLTSDLAAHAAKSTDQVVVVTLPSLQGFEIEELGYRLGRHWGIGQKDKDNGVLLVIAPNERKVRIEVGRKLEPVLTDALTKIIIENAILPRFRDGDFAGGIKAGVQDILTVLSGNAEQLSARRQSGDEKFDDLIGVLVALFWLYILGSIMWSIYQSIRYGSTGTAGSKNSSGWSMGSGGSSGGGWSSGGGGFSGGGGGFGGGGSSGGW